MATRTTTQFFVPPSAFASTPHPVTAHGSRIRYADSHECLDGVSGLWNVPLGYGHRGVADAVHHALIDASYLTHFRAGHAWADRAGSALLVEVVKTLSERLREANRMVSSVGELADWLAGSLV